MPAQVPEAQWRIRSSTNDVVAATNRKNNDSVPWQAKTDGDLAFKNGEYDKVFVLAIPISQ